MLTFVLLFMLLQSWCYADLQADMLSYPKVPPFRGRVGFSGKELVSCCSTTGVMQPYQMWRIDSFVVTTFRMRCCSQAFVQLISLLSDATATAGRSCTHASHLPLSAFDLSRLARCGMFIYCFETNLECRCCHYMWPSGAGH